MKKVIMLIFLVLTTTVLWSEEKTSGFGIEAELYCMSINKSLNSEDNSQKRANLDLVLNFSKMLSTKLEINPYFSFGISLDIEDDDSISDDSTTIETINFGLGTGLYYHFIQGKYADLSAGGRLGVGIHLIPEDDDYFEYSVNMDFPIILDIKLSDCLILRVKHNVARISYLNETTSSSLYYNNTYSETYSEINFSSYHNSDINLNIGFMFKF